MPLRAASGSSAWPACFLYSVRLRRPACAALVLALVWAAMYSIAGVRQKSPCLVLYSVWEGSGEAEGT
eukprot:1952240-Prorocentrum_lima.AAC.1